MCHKLFESLVFHSCSSPGQQVLSTFRCVLSCPQCDESVLVNTLEQDDIQASVKEHLEKNHPHSITRIYYVFKSKFCNNAFRSKDELRAHHDREHRRDNHYRNKSCSLHHTVVAAQHKFSIPCDSNDSRSSLVTIPIILNAQEKEEARTRDVPTVSSILDKTLFPDLPSAVNPNTGQHVTMIDGVKVDSLTGEVLPNTPSSKTCSDGNGSPYVCYRCGMTHTERKKHKRHVRGCTGEIRERVCRVCQNSFKGESFVLHCRYHMQQGVVLCMLCNGAQFDSVEKLHSHFEKHAHEQFVYPAVCPFCGIGLPDVHTSITHLKEKHSLLMSSANSFDNSPNIPVINNNLSSSILTPELNVSCDKCGRKFHGGRGLSIHALSCCGGTAVSAVSNSAASIRQCQACKRALTQDTMGKHMAAHLQEGFVVCGLCDGKPMASSLDLLHHLEGHTNSWDYPNSCAMCQLALEDADTALRHLKEEHGLGHLPCPECDMSYTFSQQLSRHTEIVHRICLYSKRRYICWICRAYDHVKKDTLMNHFQIAHGLQREQVNEKAMIRTRGQGTMPTAQFVPTKQINKKKPVAKVDAKTANDIKSMTTDKSPASSHFSSPESKSLLIFKDVLDVPSENKSTSVMSINSAVSPTGILPSEAPTAQSSVIIDRKMFLDKVNPTVKKIQKIIKVDIKEAFAKQKVTKVKIEEATKPKKINQVITPNNGKHDDFAKDAQTHCSNLSSGLDTGLKRSYDDAALSDTDASVDEPTKNLTSTPQLENKRRKKSKAYKCDLCIFATNFHDKLERHRQRHADGSLTGFVCQECGQSFVVQQSLTRHMFFAHKIKWQGGDGGPNNNSPADADSNKRSIKDPTYDLAEKKIKVEELSSYIEDSCDQNNLKMLPKISAHIVSRNTPEIRKNTESTIIPMKIEGNNEAGISSLKDSAVNVIKPLPEVNKFIAPATGIKKVTLVSMAPKINSVGDGVKADNKLTSHIIPKTIVISKPLQMQPLLNVNAGTRAPIKITNTSILSIVSDKFNVALPSLGAQSVLTSVRPIATSAVRLQPSQNPIQPTSKQGLTVVTTNEGVTRSDNAVNCVVKRRLSAPSSSKGNMALSLNGSDRQLVGPQVTSVALSQVTPTQSQVMAASHSLLSLSQVIVTKSTLPSGNASQSILKPVVHLQTAASSSHSPVVVTHSEPLSFTAGDGGIPLSPHYEDAPEDGLHQCGVCREEFPTAAEQYSHMRSHGMAFLQLGRKKRLSTTPTKNTEQADP